MACSLVGKETALPHIHRLTQITMGQSTLTHTQRERKISTAIHSSQKTNYEIVPSVQPSSCVTLDKLLNFSGP